MEHNSTNTAGEFWSYWLQYLAFFAIFRNFLFILFLIAAIKSNVVEWKPDPELNFGMFFIMPDLFLPLSRRRKRKSGGKISKMAPFDLNEFLQENAFLDATTHLYKRSCPSVCPSVRRSVGPSVGPSVRRSVPCYFRKTKIVDFVDEKSSNDLINNATMNDDEVVASYGPPRSLFTIFQQKLDLLFSILGPIPAS